MDSTGTLQPAPADDSWPYILIERCLLSVSDRFSFYPAEVVGSIILTLKRYIILMASRLGIWNLVLLRASTHIPLSF